MSLALGIDAGGTRTRAILADARGRVLGCGAGGTGNVHHAGEEGSQASLREAVEGALRRAGAGAGDIGSVFAGVAGVTHEASRRRWRGIWEACGPCRAALEVDHDIRIALAGGLAGRPGIALIVGTGSSCYGRTADGRGWQTGGWGALLADEGSGYFLGREALIAAVRMADGREAETPLRAAVFSWLGIGGVEEIMHRVHEVGMTRAEIAALAPRVGALAAGGEAAAGEILRRGAGLLAEMVAANHARLPTGERPEVVITGGVGTKDAGYRGMIGAAIRERVPSARVVSPQLSPVAGAALLALRAMGMELSESIIENLGRNDEQ